MEIQGTVKLVGTTQTFGSNGFRKRELVVTTQEQYPQHLMIEFVQDKTDLLNSINVGQSVKVGINLRGREWVNLRVVDSGSEGGERLWRRLQYSTGGHARWGMSGVSLLRPRRWRSV